MSVLSREFCRRCKVWWVGRAACPVCKCRLSAKERPDALPEIRPGVRAQWNESQNNQKESRR